MKCDSYPVIPKCFFIDMDHLPIMENYFPFPVNISIVQMLVLFNKSTAGDTQFKCLQP